MYDAPKVAARMPTDSFSLPVADEISHQAVSTAHITKPANAKARTLRIRVRSSPTPLTIFTASLRREPRRPSGI